MKQAKEILIALLAMVLGIISIPFVLVGLTIVLVVMVMVGAIIAVMCFVFLLVEAVKSDKKNA